MSCILRVAGKTLDVDALASASPLKPYRLDRRGERRAPGSYVNMAVHQDSCAHYVVSGQDLAPLPVQVADAIRFLALHRDALVAMLHFPGVEDGSLDFGIEWRDVFVHTDLLPAELLSLVGPLGLGIELSHYPGDGEEQ